MEVIENFVAVAIPPYICSKGITVSRENQSFFGVSLKWIFKYAHFPMNRGLHFLKNGL